MTSAERLNPQPKSALIVNSGERQGHPSSVIGVLRRYKAGDRRLPPMLAKGTKAAVLFFQANLDLTVRFFCTA